ncbi:hypothetical protein PUN28_001549 [Cardiocondyla obscurior]|uniref:Uncharacterized protein n=1 Tax=Cardiocondyla obscurior TaxID=286306 RepID=A0AAW2H5U2_9HYME
MRILYRFRITSRDGSNKSLSYPIHVQYAYTHAFVIYGTIYRPRVGERRGGGEKNHDTGIFLIIFSQWTRCVETSDGNGRQRGQVARMFT